jgi:hypothetical protein
MLIKTAMAASIFATLAFVVANTIVLIRFRRHVEGTELFAVLGLSEILCVEPV